MQSYDFVDTSSSSWQDIFCNSIINTSIVEVEQVGFCTKKHYCIPFTEASTNFPK